MADCSFLFVYGTLRRGAGHDMGRWLDAHPEWCGPAVCAPAQLYCVDWYPALVPGREASEGVAGDLYRLHDADALWPVLDHFEGVAGNDDDEYLRRISEVVAENGRQVAAWAYWYRRPVGELPRIVSGDWLRR